MNIALTILILIVGGLIALVSDYPDSPRKNWPRRIALITVLLAFLPILPLLANLLADQSALTLSPWGQQSTLTSGYWLSVLNVPWIEPLGINLLMAVDGFSLALIVLTLFLGITAVLSAWKEIQNRQGFFFFNLLLTLAGVLGVFSSMDLLLFFFFWEVMLVPMFLLISIWGHENRQYAALKFFIYTQASSLLLLISIWVLVFLHWKSTGVWSFSWFDMVESGVGNDAGIWVMLGFFVAFVVKLPGVPFHNWLPDAHTQAPTAGSVILAGVLLKTGAYGLIRFIPPLFPSALMEFSNIGMFLGVLSVLYGAKLAFAQTDVKRLIAYSSISHMGFVLIALFTWNPIALQGAAVQMLAHGLSSAGLFALAGALQYRLHTRDLNVISGLWSQTPRLSAFALIFILAALGLPGLGNFIGEFLVLLGTFRDWPVVTVIAALAMILAPIYALMVMQKAFHGEVPESQNTHDFDAREITMMSLLVIALVIIGLFPNLVMQFTEPAMMAISNISP